VPTHPPELRPYRVAIYILFSLFTFTFIGSVIRSVWMDLYGRPPTPVVSQLSAEHCADEIDALHRDLDARMSMPLTPRTAKNREKFEQEWDRFTRAFEDRLHRVQTDCVDQGAGGMSAAVHDAMSTSVERLDTLRQHLARCGQDGERERESLAAAIDQLKDAARVPR
jgi:hypothetical protein